MDFFVEANKIILREMEVQDWIGVHSYASKEIVCKYQPWGPNDEQQSKDFVNEVFVDAQKKERIRFVFSIIEKESGSMVGAGEINIQDFANRTGEIGYIVNPDFWGNGIATEVAKLLLEFGFRKLQLHRIYATCDPRNIASSKVLEKIGMMREGRMRENLLLKDGWRDSYLYSMLEHEWE